MKAIHVCVCEQKRDKRLWDLWLLNWEKSEKLLKREQDFRKGAVFVLDLKKPPRRYF